MYDLISRSPLFTGIGPEELSVLIDKIHFRIKHFQKGEVIVLREDACNHLMILMKGSVTGEMLDFSGKTIKIEDIEAPRAIPTQKIILEDIFDTASALFILASNRD